MLDNRTGILLATALCGLATSSAEELEEIVVSGSASDPTRYLTEAETIHSFDETSFDATTPRQLSDFFRNSGSGFIQEFSAGHSSINLRGGTTLGAGQAWSNASEVALLINGRSSATANLAKLSLHDVGEIEIIRGTSSVLHGAAAMGGVINLKTKDGTSFRGTELTSIFSSFNRYSQIIQHGGKHGKFDYYLELSATASDDYDTGRGSSGYQPNTSYKQRSANLTLGYEINERDRLEFMFRHDGIYDAGHPGATYSLTDHDNRYGTSLELTYTGSTTDDRFSWKNQTWYNRDVDELHWSQDPLIGLIPAVIAPGLIGTPGIIRDVNQRRLQEWGNRFSSDIRLSRSNTLTAGAEIIYSDLSSHRERQAADGYLGGLIGIPVNLAPLSVDARMLNTGVFFQDSQRFFDDRLTLNAGARYEHRDQKALPTQHSDLKESTNQQDIFVYQASALYRPKSWLSFRGNLGTGMLPPNPTQLFGTVQQTNGFAFIPNPDLDSERSFGWDIGASIATSTFLFDVSLYENTIKDYMVGTVAGPGSLQWQNAEERIVRGIELRISQNIAPLLGLEGFHLTPYLNGNYYLKDQSVDLEGNTAGHPYINDYNLCIGLRGGRTGKWDANLFATLAGHAEVSAGFLQNANVGTANITRNYDIPKTAILNFSASYRLNDNTNFFFGINNIFDKNYSTSSYILNNGDTSDVAPYLLPGIASGEGLSAPGREYFAGLSFTF